MRKNFLGALRGLRELGIARNCPEFSLLKYCKHKSGLNHIIHLESINKPPPQRVGGRGRDIVGKFLSEEKRNERFCLGAGTFNRSREPKRRHCVLL